VDIILSAFSVFMIQSPSFLEPPRRMKRDRDNATRLFQLDTIPGDHHSRHQLDRMEPEQCDEGFDLAMDDWQPYPGLEKFTRLENRTLTALDGSEFHRSQKIHCPHCLTFKRRGQTTDYGHQVLVAPGHSQVIPLRPEFIRSEDGTVKSMLPSAGGDTTILVISPCGRSILAMPGMRISRGAARFSIWTVTFGFGSNPVRIQLCFANLKPRRRGGTRCAARIRASPAGESVSGIPNSRWRTVTKP